jgi:hypothetical protein
MTIILIITFNYLINGTKRTNNEASNRQQKLSMDMGSRGVALACRTTMAEQYICKRTYHFLVTVNTFLIALLRKIIIAFVSIVIISVVLYFSIKSCLSLNRPQSVFFIENLYLISSTKFSFDWVNLTLLCLLFSLLFDFFFSYSLYHPCCCFYLPTIDPADDDGNDDDDDDVADKPIWMFDTRNN